MQNRSLTLGSAFVVPAGLEAATGKANAKKKEITSIRNHLQNRHAFKCNHTWKNMDKVLLLHNNRQQSKNHPIT